MEKGLKATWGLNYTFSVTMIDILALLRLLVSLQYIYSPWYKSTIMCFAIFIRSCLFFCSFIITNSQINSFIQSGISAALIYIYIYIFSSILKMHIFLFVYFHHHHPPLPLLSYCSVFPSIPLLMLFAI